jgi:hypothetical protein
MSVGVPAKLFAGIFAFEQAFPAVPGLALCAIGPIVIMHLIFSLAHVKWRHKEG